MARERIVIEFDTANKKERRIYKAINNIKNHSNKSNFSKSFIEFLDDMVKTVVEQEDALEACERRDEACQKALTKLIARNINWVRNIGVRKTRDKKKDN